jgi:hypothetical protein
MLVYAGVERQRPAPARPPRVPECRHKIASSLFFACLSLAFAASDLRLLLCCCFLLHAQVPIRTHMTQTPPPPSQATADTAAAASAAFDAVKAVLRSWTIGGIGSEAMKGPVDKIYELRRRCASINKPLQAHQVHAAFEEVHVRKHGMGDEDEDVQLKLDPDEMATALCAVEFDLFSTAKPDDVALQTPNRHMPVPVATPAAAAGGATPAAGAAKADTANADTAGADAAAPLDVMPTQRNMLDVSQGVGPGVNGAGTVDVCAQLFPVSVRKTPWRRALCSMRCAAR